MVEAGADFMVEAAVASTEATAVVASMGADITEGADTTAAQAPTATKAEGRSEACAEILAAVRLHRDPGPGKATLLLVRPHPAGTDLEAAPAEAKAWPEGPSLGMRVAEQPRATWPLTKPLPTEIGTRLVLPTPKPLVAVQGRL